MACLFHVVLIVLMSLIDRHVFSKELIVVNIVSGRLLNQDHTIDFVFLVSITTFNSNT